MRIINVTEQGITIEIDHIDAEGLAGAIEEMGHLAYRVDDDSASLLLMAYAGGLKALAALGREVQTTACRRRERDKEQEG